MYITSKKKFGDYIRKIRIEKGISREELAEKLFVTVAAICKWENGKRYPDFETLGNLADELGISTQDIYDNSREEKDNSNLRKIVNIISVFLLFGVVATGIVLGIINRDKRNNSTMGSKDDNYTNNSSENNDDNTHIDKLEGNKIDAYLVMGNVFQKEGITNGKELIYNYDWDDNNIVCSDPSCKHIEYKQNSNPTPTCSAAIKNEIGISMNSFVFNEKRIIVENYIKNIETDDNNDEVCYGSIFYEADDDGKNRRKINTMDGLVYFASGIIYTDHLYCSVLKEIQSEKHEEYDENTGMNSITVDSIYKYELRDINLNDMTYVLLAESNNPFTQFTASGNRVFCTEFNNENVNGTVYSIKDGKADIFYNGQDLVSLGGLVNDKLMIVCQNDYEYENRLYDINTKKYTVICTSKEALCGVIGNNYLIKTDVVLEDDKNYDGYMSFYSEYDINGNLIRKLAFKDNINYCFMIDNRVIIYDNFSTDYNKSAGYYWIDYNEFKDKCEFENHIDLR